MNERKKKNYEKWKEILMQRKLLFCTAKEVINESMDKYFYFIFVCYANVNIETYTCNLSLFSQLFFSLPLSLRLWLSVYDF